MKTGDRLQLETAHLQHDKRTLIDPLQLTTPRPSDIPSGDHLVAAGAEQFANELDGGRLAVCPGNGDDLLAHAQTIGQFQLAEDRNSSAPRFDKDGQIRPDAGGEDD